jgi:AmiR/NasT family two-component response regulator
MTELQPGLGEPESDPFVLPTGPATGPRDTALVVSGARVTTIVIARIVTMAGLKCITAAPADVEAALREARLAAVILDDEPHLASRVADRTILGPQGRPAQRPFVILLATAGRTLEAGRSSPHCDAVLAKPLASDTLYPLLFDIRQRMGGLGAG